MRCISALFYPATSCHISRDCHHNICLYGNIRSLSVHRNKLDWPTTLPYAQWVVGSCLTCVRATCILNPTEVPLHADAYAVILFGQLKSCPWIIVIGLYLSWHTGEVLKTALFSWKDIFVNSLFTGSRKTDMSYASWNCNEGVLLVTQRERERERGESGGIDGAF